MAVVFFKLLFVHLLSDFVLQTDKFVKKKATKSWRGWHLYVHALVLHGGLSWLLIQDLSFWYGALAIGISHGIIDWVKIRLKNLPYQPLYFVADQLLHVVILFVVAAVYTQTPLAPIWPVLGLNHWIMAGAVLFLTMPASILIRIVVAQWAPGKTAENGLKHAGNLIGIIERLLIFVFIISGQFSAVGFLLAAKSIFRFGDLRGTHDRALTEYVMIGTLLSFGLAIGITMGMQWLIAVLMR